jgi:hypothetical protein
MADRTINVGIQQRGGGAPIVLDLPFAANAWKLVEMRINSTDWNAINGLFIGYTARVSIDGGNTWTPWGGLTASSPTFMKDGVTKVPPGGIWEWSSAFNAGGTLSLVVDCPTAFAWGATITLTDT